MISSADSLRDLTVALAGTPSLGGDAIRFAARALLSEAVTLPEKADFLRALTARGESAEEIAGLVEAFLEHAVDPALDPATLPGPMLDVCGTGGDRLHLFNVSTTSMFVLAAGGAVVVKHGNRSITSQCGGADVLEALGIPVEQSPEALREQVRRTGLGFLFAPLYHPAFKVIGPVRKQLAAEGVATVFNLLGPLLNPARPAHQLIGIFSKPVLAKYASVLQQLGRQQAWVVHGESSDGQGMDELSTMGPTDYYTVSPKAIATARIDRETIAQLGLVPATLEELRGGDRQVNATILRDILSGTLRGPKRDLVLLNAAAGFVVVGLAGNLAEGLDLAARQIDSGRALEKLRALQA
ncbi:MAG TPA: anthranilate phosphoribosyltransferase [Chthoniobacteraceae bacterium]|nr:anthranilate phosphoribosyltransferase [Chthoniobacteraceae bacterium]